MQKAQRKQQNKAPTKVAKATKVAKKVVKTPKRKLTTKKLNALKAPFALPTLPFAADALAPHMSSETLSYHHGKHHQTYITNLNNLIKTNNVEDADLETLIAKSNSKALPVGVFNNAAQHFNHSFFWTCLKPGGGKEPTGSLAAQINKDFGSFADFKTQFANNCLGHFGSGWVFLTLDPKSKKLAIEQHHDASTPQVNGTKAIFTVDVWEHAYYIDARNARGQYVNTVMDNLANWDFAQQNFDEASAV